MRRISGVLLVLGGLVAITYCGMLSFVSTGALRLGQDWSEPRNSEAFHIGFMLGALAILCGIVFVITSQGDSGGRTSLDDRRHERPHDFSDQEAGADHRIP